MEDHLKIVIFEGSIKPPVFIEKLAGGLAERGHEMWFLHFGSHRKSAPKNLKYFSLGGKSKVGLIFRSFLLSLKGDRNSILNTFRYIYKGNREMLQKQNLHYFIEDIEPDLIHVQWPSLLTTLQDILEKQQVPVVLSQRGYQINVKPFANIIYLQKLRKIFPKLAGFHSVSHAISKRGDELYNTSNKIDEVIYTGIELEKIPFNNEFSKQESIKLLSLGRPHWVKSYTDVLQACRILKDKDIQFEYTIIGADGNEELLFLIHKFHLQREVKVLNKLEQLNAFEMIRASHLLVVSSIAEGLPNVIVESMALGTPVLSTASGGVEELIRDGETGWLTPIRDPQAMAGKIEHFWSLPLKDINIIRKAARKKVEEQHTTDQMIEGMENLYRKVLHKQKV